MKHLISTLFFTLILCAVVSCDKAPSGVIPESKMEKLIVDLGLADAYIESHFDEFPDDSSRLVLKQSVFMKYGITPEMYDTSLVWYARNMDVYLKVYDNAIGRLQKMRSENPAEANRPQMGGPGGMAAHRTYTAKGDTADIWSGPRRWVFTRGMSHGFITFDFEPDEEYRAGDRYDLQVKVNPMRSTFRLMIAADYSDGGTVYTVRGNCNDGWNNLQLQSDSTRNVSRIYGYIDYNLQGNDIAYVDSMSLVRTHASRETYSAVWGHKVIERVKREQPTNVNTAATEASQAQVPAVNVPTQGHFKPKEGVNKSSAQRHVTQSPNAAHLPKK